jgi:hypothetical protein
MENDLIKVNPVEFGLQATEAAQVEAVFLPMIAKMNELELEFNDVLALPVEPTTCKKAKELRLKFVKIRTGTAEIHKKAKEYYRKGGLFVDAWKNAQAFTSQGKESALEKIECHFEILEAERKEKLKTERLALLIGLCDDPTMYPVQDMSEPAFKQLVDGLTLAKKQKEEAERKAEEERVAKEKAEAEERERIRLENERLKEEKRVAEIERQRQEKILAEERAKAEAEKKAAEETIRRERLAAQAAADVARQKAESEKAQLEKARAAEAAKSKAEREESEKKAAEELRKINEKARKECAEAEEKARSERERARIEKERLEKLLADTIKCPKCKHEFSISQTKGK